MCKISTGINMDGNLHRISDDYGNQKEVGQGRKVILGVCSKCSGSPMNKLHTVLILKDWTYSGYLATDNTFARRCYRAYSLQNTRACLSPPYKNRKQ